MCEKFQESYIGQCLYIPMVLLSSLFHVKTTRSILYFTFIATLEIVRTHMHHKCTRVYFLTQVFSCLSGVLKVTPFSISTPLSTIKKVYDFSTPLPPTHHRHYFFHCQSHFHHLNILCCFQSYPSFHHKPIHNHIHFSPTHRFFHCIPTIPWPTFHHRPTLQSIPIFH